MPLSPHSLPPPLLLVLLLPPRLKLLLQMPLQPRVLIPKLPPTPPTFQPRIQIPLPSRPSSRIGSVEWKCFQGDEEIGGETVVVATVFEGVAVTVAAEDVDVQVRHAGYGVDACYDFFGPVASLLVVVFAAR